MKITFSLTLATLITLGIGLGFNETVIKNHQLEQSNE